MIPRAMGVVALMALSACAVLPSSPQDDMATFVFDDTGAAPVEEPPGYFESRLRDLGRVLSLRLAVGPGLGFRAAATKAVQVAAMYRGPADAFGQLLHFDNVIVGNTGPVWGAWDVRSSEYGFLGWYSYQEDVLDFQESDRRWAGGYEDRSPTAFEAALHLGWVGGTVSFDPLAIVGLVAGIFGFGEGGWSDGS